MRARSSNVPDGSGEELTQTCGGGLLAVERGQADNTVLVGEGFQPIGFKRLGNRGSCCRSGVASGSRADEQRLHGAADLNF